MRTLSLLGLITAAALPCSCKSGEQKPNLWPGFLGSGFVGSAPAQHLLEGRRDSLIGQLTKQVERPGRADFDFKHHNDAGKYPVGEAMKDVLDYYQAGTFVSAMIETQNSAAQVETDAKEVTDKPAT